MANDPAADAPVGGNDTRNWWWHQTLNIFSAAPGVPSRTTVTAPAWLKSDCFRHARGPGNHVPGNLVHVETMTLYTSYYGVADLTSEASAALTAFESGSTTVLKSLAADTNALAQQATFEKAALALNGTASWLTAQVKPLHTWRDKAGHRGDDFQGNGAGAFWDLLNGLAFKCEDLVAQISKVRTSWDALRDAKGFLHDAGVSLDEGYQRWRGGESFTYDTGLGFSVTGTGSALASPGGAVTAVWTAPPLVADFAAHGPKDYYRDEESYPTSTILGGKVTDSAMWQKLEEAAKRVWVEHQSILDSYAASMAGMLSAAYLVAAGHLPTVTTPVPLVFPGSGPGPGDGPGPGSGDGGSGTTGGNGDQDGNYGTTDVHGPPPPVPPPGVSRSGSTHGPGGPAGWTGGGDTALKVPTGSHVDTDGHVVGPDGKYVLGSDGRPVIVPPGSWVNANGEIVGRNGGRLDQKDRLRKVYESTSGWTRGNGGESAVERYLKSLGRSSPPVPPPRLSGGTLPLTMSRSDPLSGFHSGPGAMGGGRVGASAPGPVLPGGGKPPVPTAGGPVSAEGPPGAIGRGNGGVPFYPPTAGGPGGAGGGKGERDRATWLAEDERTWGTDAVVAPGVLGRRRRGRRRAPEPRTASKPGQDYTMGLGDHNTEHGISTG
ncbi:hypothetical protein [Amycolatopsis samaneae]|uniref:PPE family protein n=1 Tax=Amycolatopsis samaneae TaxID=664691 RepID=A0ABW5GDD5_9PSEU